MGKAPLLDAAAQNGVNSSTPFRCNVVAVGAGGGICESIDTVCSGARRILPHTIRYREVLVF